MKTPLKSLFGVALLLAAVLPSHAADWNILIVGDITTDTEPAGHPAWRSADRAITQALIDQGFDVFDKPTLGLARDCRGESCEGYSVNDLIGLVRELNRTADEPVDLMVLYSVSFTQRDGAAINRYQVRSSARMVDIEKGRTVDQWSNAMQEHNDPSVNCKGPCLRLWKADRARESAMELGSVLAEKLAAYVRTYTFRISLREFTPTERDRVLAGLRQAPDYQAGSLEEFGLGNRTREWLHQRVSGSYELTTPLRIGPLRSRIERLVAEAGASGSVLVRGNRLEVTRDGFPYLGRYITALLTPFVLLALFMVWQRYARYDEMAAELARKDVPSDGLKFLDQKPLPFLPRQPRWERLREQWRARVERADQAVARARVALERRDFAEAASALGEARKEDAGHAAAITEQQRLETLRRADQLVREGEALVESDPSTASKKLTEAMALDGDCEQAAKPLLHAAETRLRDTVVRDGLASAESALSSGQHYGAASYAGHALFAIQGLDGFDDERSKLESIRERACSALKPLQGDARAAQGLVSTRFLTANEVGIGRAHGVLPGAITMNYKRASRVGKQAVIRREGQRLFFVDKGSTHGTLVNDSLLANGQPRRLSGEALVALGGGREPPRPGAARLKITVPDEAGDSAIVRFDHFHLKLLDADDLDNVWPTMRDDMRRSWVMLRSAVTICNDGNKLRLGEPEEQQPGFRLGYDQGYWVEPLPSGIDERVSIDGQAVTTRMPLMAGIAVNVDGIDFSLEEAGR